MEYFPGRLLQKKQKQRAAKIGRWSLDIMCKFSVRLWEPYPRLSSTWTSFPGWMNLALAFSKQTLQGMRLIPSPQSKSYKARWPRNRFEGCKTHIFPNLDEKCFSVFMCRRPNFVLGSHELPSDSSLALGPEQNFTQGLSCLNNHNTMGMKSEPLH